MTVKELIDQLKLIPGEMLVVQASDAEGNSFSEVMEISFGAFSRDEQMFGKEKLTAADRAKGFTSDDVVKGPAAVCLWPQ